MNLLKIWNILLLILMKGWGGGGVGEYHFLQTSREVSVFLFKFGGGCHFLQTSIKVSVFLLSSLGVSIIPSNLKRGECNLPSHF